MRASHCSMIYSLQAHFTLFMCIWEVATVRESLFYHIVHDYSLGREHSPACTVLQYRWRNYGSLRQLIEGQAYPRLSQRPCWKSQGNLVLCPCPRADVASSHLGWGQGLGFGSVELGFSQLKRLEFSVPKPLCVQSVMHLRYNELVFSLCTITFLLTVSHCMMAFY